MSDLQLVIFDCDGVLVDSEVISNDVLARSLTEQGLPTTLAQSRRDYQGLLLAEIDSRAQAKLGRPLAQDWLGRYERDRAAVFRRELRAVPGVAEAVRRIQAADMAVCVASQGKLEKTRLSLQLTKLDPLFEDEAHREDQLAALIDAMRDAIGANAAQDILARAGLTGSDAGH